MGTSQTPLEQRDRGDGPLRAKIVYYGPAHGGKTTNLETLHRVAAAADGHELFTVKTDKDRTLFFDLLPVELGEFLGFPVVINLYAVPGQVRYEATRKVVLGGADAILFVADSQLSRREQNVWSLQNLHMNLRAGGVEPEDVPILFQFNKRDLEDAAPMSEVAEWLRTTPEQAVPAVASRGEGVLESLKHACQVVLPQLIERSGNLGRTKIDTEELERWIDRALAPLKARLAAGFSGKPIPDAAPSPIVLTDDDLLEGAIETSVRLSEDRFVEVSRCRRLAREADASRRLGESLFKAGASFNRRSMLEAALSVAGELPKVKAVTLIRQAPDGRVVQEGAAGCDRDPLLGLSAGRRLLKTMLAAEGPSLIDDLAESCRGREATDVLKRLGALAAVPVGQGEGRILVAYAARKKGVFEPDDMDFLHSVARHLAAGLGKASVHEDLVRHRGRLEQNAPRTGRRSEGARRAVDQIRERMLGNFPSEMGTTVATISSAARALKKCRGDAEQREQILGSIVGSAELLHHQLDDLSQLIHVADAEPLRLAEVPPRRLIKEALRIAGRNHVRSKLDEPVKLARFDLQGLARAVANLIDNAVKFSRSGSPVSVHLRNGKLETAEGGVDAMVISVRDRGQGVPSADRERIFAPFATGKKTASGKPSGLGIGLYEARSQARRHGGTLEYFPRKGEGSEFRLTVPLQPIAAPVVREVTHA